MDNEPVQRDTEPSKCHLKDMLQQLNSIIATKPCEKPVIRQEEAEDPTCTPIFWIKKWVGYSEHGLGYQLCDNSVGMLFNDNTCLITYPDGDSLRYIKKTAAASYVSACSFPTALSEKIRLLKRFCNCISELPLKTRAKIARQGRNELARLPYVSVWFKTVCTIALHLTNGTVQINFFQDQTKLILCPRMGVVTYIDKMQDFHTYKLSLLEEFGCSKEMSSRFSYAKLMVEKLLTLFHCRKLDPSPQRDTEPSKCHLKDMLQQLNSIIAAKPCEKPVIRQEEAEDLACTPIFWISRWVDNSNYGLCYQLCDNSVGMLFNDNTCLITYPDGDSLRYIKKTAAESYVSACSIPTALNKKIKLLKSFCNYMSKHLLKTGANMPRRGRNELTRLPYVSIWFKTDCTIALHLTNGTVQINFFQDQTKLILCPRMGVVTYIDKMQDFHTYKLFLLEEFGCSKEMSSRISYAKLMVEKLLTLFHCHKLGPSPKKDTEPSKCHLKDMLQQLNSIIAAKPCEKPVICQEEAEDPACTPIFWISRWVDNSNYGLCYQLCDNSVGMLFNDNTCLITYPDGDSLRYIKKTAAESYVSACSFPTALNKKIQLLKSFCNYMSKHLLKTGANMPRRGRNELTRLPYVSVWFITDCTIALHLTNGTVQINFFQDQTKLILCPLMGAVTYIDKMQDFHTYKLSLLEEFGCSKEMSSRISYAKLMVEKLLDSKPSIAAN
ncbi:hypothetical protein Q5P01_009918 [Channa striata]|uniref:POLO box domain-containing protein n=1 Tax=Channa striata TaxID=64152 RepID=A0AA88MWU7_CHASR|nr:hypothetical protein Q5P01_009918 [Channa striata]